MTSQTTNPTEEVCTVWVGAIDQLISEREKMAKECQERVAVLYEEIRLLEEAKQAGRDAVNANLYVIEEQVDE